MRGNMNHPTMNGRTENRSFQKLKKLVRPQGLHCPDCHERDGLQVCRRHAQSWVPDCRCSRCGSVFNAWTGTPLQGTHHQPSELWRLIQGMRRGEPTSTLAEELGCQRRPLASLRRKLQLLVTRVFGPPPKKSL